MPLFRIVSDASFTFTFSDLTATVFDLIRIHTEEEKMSHTLLLIRSTLSYIGWTSINVFSISSESQFIGASKIVLPSTWWTAVCVRLTFPVVSSCGQPIGVSWSCHDIVAASLDADRSPLQLRWSGTHFQTPFGTQR